MPETSGMGTHQTQVDGDIVDANEGKKVALIMILIS